jgi:hypothetical protein
MYRNAKKQGFGGDCHYLFFFVTEPLALPMGVVGYSV